MLVEPQLLTMMMVFSLLCDAEDISALEEHLKKAGAVDTAHSPAPTRDPDSSLSNGAKSDFLVKLMSHVRLHFLYLAEKLQEQLVAPEGEMATATPAPGSGNAQVRAHQPLYPACELVWARCGP